MDTFVCPSDQDVAAQAELAGISYNANTGAWDRDGGDFLIGPNWATRSTTACCLIWQNTNDRGAKGPISRAGKIKDGAATTLLLAENIHKSYSHPTGGGAPLFGWVGAPEGYRSTYPSNEQQLGMVWVVSAPPILPTRARAD